MILSKTTFKIKCKNGSRLISRFVSNKIKLTNVIITDIDITFTINNKYISKVTNIANDFGYKLEIISSSGMQGLLKKCFVVLPFTITIIIMSTLTFVMSLFVFNVKVFAVDNSECNQIYNYLYSNGYDKVLFKGDIDLKKLENDLLNNIPSINFVTCYIDGISLKVNISKGNIPNEKPKGESLVANYEGMVTRVMVRSGTPLVKEGEIVKVGQELIGGYHLIDNNPTDDSDGEEKVECSADGEVYGIVYHHKRVYLPDKFVYMQKTGKSKVIREMFIGNLRIGGSHKIPYEHYQYVKNEEYFMNILTIKFVTYTYYEYSAISMDKNAYIDKIVLEANQDIIENMPIGSKIIKTQYLEKNIEGKNVLDIFIEVEQRLDNGGYNY